jgi:indolepyruvate ferredoxin oxidoreductase beta subunit
MAAHVLGHGRIVQTTSFRGFLQLYFVSELRRWRRRSLRFHEEQARIERWLQQVSETVREDYNAALQVAEFPRVVKGYGDTHISGRRKFDLLSSALPYLRGRNDTAAVLRWLIDAALADESGAKLDEALKPILEAKPLARKTPGMKVMVSPPPAAG